MRKVIINEGMIAKIADTIFGTRGNDELENARQQRRSTRQDIYILRMFRIEVESNPNLDKDHKKVVLGIIDRAIKVYKQKAASEAYVGERNRYGSTEGHSFGEYRNWAIQWCQYLNNNGSWYMIDPVVRNYLQKMAYDRTSWISRKDMEKMAEDCIYWLKNNHYM